MCIIFRISTPSINAILSSVPNLSHLSFQVGFFRVLNTTQLREPILGKVTHC